MIDDYTQLRGRKALRCSQVLDAASICFVDKGFHGAGMAEIADQAQMSTGHIYHYFRNKDAIIKAIVIREGQRVLELVQELRQLPADSFAEFLIDRLDEHLIGDETLFQSRLSFEILAESQRNPEIAGLLRENESRKTEVIENILREKFDRDDIPDIVDALNTLFAGVSASSVRLGKTDGARLSPALRRFLRDLFAEKR